MVPSNCTNETNLVQDILGSMDDHRHEVLTLANVQRASKSQSFIVSLFKLWSHFLLDYIFVCLKIIIQR